MKIIGMLLMAVVTFTGVHAADSSLPDFGSSTSRTLSLTQEQLVGDDYMRMVRRMLPLVQDPQVVEYIQHLGFKLVEQNPEAESRRFYFFVVQDPSLNAFALPGGYIGIHTGLILAAENESELAAVVAHEIAHVTQRHLARRLERMQQLSLPTLAAFLGSILVAAADPEAGMAAMTASQAGATQAIINHTRSNEKEADRIGMQALSDSGLDPQAMATFFEKMQVATRYMRKPPEFLSTHPVNQTRITDARLRARSLPPPKNVTSKEFELFKQKVRHLLSNDSPAQQHQLSELYKKSPPQGEVDNYGYALWLTSTRQYNKAETVISELLEKDPRNHAYVLAKSELALAQNKPEEALPLVKDALKISPTNLALIAAQSELLMAAQEYAAARKLLLEHMHHKDAEPNILKTLAEAQSRAGFVEEMHETQGQYLLKMGDLPGARQQFEIALNKRTEDPFARQRLNARINEIKTILTDRRNRH